YRIGEENGLRREIGVAAARELVGPILLDAVNETDDAAVLALVGVGAGLAILHGRRVVDRRIRAAVVGKRIDAEEQRDDQDDDADPSASDDDRTTQTTAGSAAASALIFDLRWIEGRVAAKCHVRTERNKRASGVASCEWRKRASQPKASGKSTQVSLARRKLRKRSRPSRIFTTTTRTATRSSGSGSTGRSCSPPSKVRSTSTRRRSRSPRNIRPSTR